MRAASPHGCTLTAAGPDREIEAIAFGNEQRGTGALDGRDACELLISVAVPLDHVEEARTAAEINPLPLGIEKDVVRITAG